MRVEVHSYSLLMSIDASSFRETRTNNRIIIFGPLILTTEVRLTIYDTDSLIVTTVVQQFSSIHAHHAWKSAAPHCSAIDCNVPVGISSSDFIGTVTIRTSSVSGCSYRSFRWLPRCPARLNP